MCIRDRNKSGYLRPILNGKCLMMGEEEEEEGGGRGEEEKEKKKINKTGE